MRTMEMILLVSELIGQAKESFFRRDTSGQKAARERWQRSPRARVASQAAQARAIALTLRATTKQSRQDRSSQASEIVLQWRQSRFVCKCNGAL